jgi:hypothetical protein
VKSSSKINTLRLGLSSRNVSSHNSRQNATIHAAIEIGLGFLIPLPLLHGQPVEDMNEILQSAVLAPYGEATGIPLREIRKVFVLSRSTQSMNRARELLTGQLRRNPVR